MRARPSPGRTRLRIDNERRCARLLERSELLDTTDLDWDTVPGTSVDARTLETLVYMRDVEGFTPRYLDGLAGHPATGRDPLVGRFLDVWAAEEMEHARAVDRFLTTYAAGRGIAVPPAQPPPPPPPAWRERAVVALTAPLGSVVTAAHMAWGAANELLTLNGYRLLGERCGHPQLRVLLSRIAAQEARHYAFYRLQAEWRMAESRLARTTVSRLLHRSWTPVGVGSGYKGRDDFDRVLGHLTADPDGVRRLTAMDAAMARLPGCDGLGIFGAVARQAGPGQPAGTRGSGPAPGPGTATTSRRDTTSPHLEHVGTTSVT